MNRVYVNSNNDLILKPPRQTQNPITQRNMTQQKRGTYLLLSRCEGRSGHLGNKPQKRGNYQVCVEIYRSMLKIRKDRNHAESHVQYIRSREEKVERFHAVGDRMSCSPDTWRFEATLIGTSMYAQWHANPEKHFKAKNINTAVEI